MKPTTLTTPLPWEGKGEGPHTANAVTSARKPVSVTFGPKYSERLSKSELLSLLRSDLQVASRKINLIVLHVSDTKPSQNFTVEKLAACHKARNFGDYIGYHLYVRRDGTLYYTRPVQIKGCHVSGHNANSIGICSEGGHRENELQGRKYEDNRTAEQMIVLHELLTVLHELLPDAKICGHHDLNPAKACPCMDPPAAKEYAYIFA